MEVNEPQTKLISSLVFNLFWQQRNDIALYFLIDWLLLISVKSLGDRTMTTIMMMIMTGARRPGAMVTAPARVTVTTEAAMTGAMTRVTGVTGDTRSSQKSQGRTDTPRQTSNARKPVRLSTWRKLRWPTTRSASMSTRPSVKTATTKER